MLYHTHTPPRMQHVPPPANWIWCRVACRVGVATSLEPVLRPLQGSQSAAIPNRLESEGDFLLALQVALSVVDVSVVHPLQRLLSMQLHEGSAAAVTDQATLAQYENSNPVRDEFVPLSTEEFSRK